MASKMCVYASLLRCLNPFSKLVGSLVIFVVYATYEIYFISVIILLILWAIGITLPVKDIFPSRKA